VVTLWIIFSVLKDNGYPGRLWSIRSTYHVDLHSQRIAAVGIT